jgi:D-3-phosphoglycerate dehydrogenase
MCATAVANRSLVLDLLEWIGTGQRPYAEVMEAWRTSCPRLSIWEDALEHGFVACVSPNGAGSMVEVTASGRAFLHAERITP